VGETHRGPGVGTFMSARGVAVISSSQRLA